MFLSIAERLVALLVTGSAGATTPAQNRIRAITRIDRFVLGVPPPPAIVDVIWPKLVADGLELLGVENCEWLVTL